MSRPQSRISSLWARREVFLGIRLGKLDTLMSDTSCMSEEMREAYSHVEAVQSVLKYAVQKRELPLEDAKELNEICNLVIKPILVSVGRTSWPRDIVTDMGLALSREKTPEVSLKPRGGE